MPSPKPLHPLDELELLVAIDGNLSLPADAPRARATTTSLEHWRAEWLAAIDGKRYGKWRLHQSPLEVALVRRVIAAGAAHREASAEDCTARAAARAAAAA